MHFYFDDSLLRHLDPNVLFRQTVWVLQLLARLGFCPSIEKSELLPSQDAIFVGIRYRLDLGLAFPPLAKFLALVTMITSLQHQSYLSARYFLRLLGVLNSLADVVPLGRLHIRPLQFYLLSQWRPASRDLEFMIPFPASAHQHLDWWKLEQNVLAGVPLAPPLPQATLFTDSSMTGWGAELQGQTI